MRVREEWRPVVGFEERYEVSNRGRVRSYATGNGNRRRVPIVLEPGCCNGYENYVLSKDNRKFNKKGHRMVLEAFVGAQPPNKPECLHGNGIRNDNRPSNLRWGTRKENAQDAVKHRTLAGEKNGRAKLTVAAVRQIRNRYAQGETTYKKLAARYGVSKAMIGFAVTRRTWKDVA